MLLRIDEGFGQPSEKRAGGCVRCLLHVLMLCEQAALMLSPQKWRSGVVPGTGGKQTSVVATAVLAA